MDYYTRLFIQGTFNYLCESTGGVGHRMAAEFDNYHVAYAEFS